MNLHDVKIWEVVVGAVLICCIAAIAAWLVYRKRPTPEEIEFARRQFLTQLGRLVDGTLLDVTEIPDEDGHPLTMLIYAYRIGGVNYECSQDITHMGSTLDPEHIRAGFPCSVRYQPGSPQNSIVVAERWSGLRTKLPVYPTVDRPRYDAPRQSPNTPGA